MRPRSYQALAHDVLSLPQDLFALAPPHAATLTGAARTDALAAASAATGSTSAGGGTLDPALAYVLREPDLLWRALRHRHVSRIEEVRAAPPLRPRGEVRASPCPPRPRWRAQTLGQAEREGVGSLVRRRPSAAGSGGADSASAAGSALDLARNAAASALTLTAASTMEASLRDEAECACAAAPLRRHALPCVRSPCRARRCARHRSDLPKRCAAHRAIVRACVQQMRVRALLKARPRRPRPPAPSPP